MKTLMSYILIFMCITTALWFLIVTPSPETWINALFFGVFSALVYPSYLLRYGNTWKAVKWVILLVPLAAVGVIYYAALGVYRVGETCYNDIKDKRA